MSLTDEDWKRIELALAFRSSRLQEQGAGSAFRESCYDEARRYDEIIPKVRDFRRATGWQPIETAPKGRKAVLVYRADTKCTFGATWDGDANGWRHFGGSGHPIYGEITHWMPLPEPPKGGAE